MAANQNSPNTLDKAAFDDGEDNNFKDESPVLTPAQHRGQLFRDIEILRSKYKANPVWSQEQEVARIQLVCEILKVVHDYKSQTYGPSWKKRGWTVSIFGNIARKFDRLEKIFMNPELVLKFIEKPSFDAIEESVVDTFADLAVYGMLALTEFMVMKPELFNHWMNSSLKNN